ncbi:MAG: hypothetical protein M1516_01045 [Firmicutes bacterium]|nr:hypothetical protein [Bacillota bacterium]
MDIVLHRIAAADRLILEPAAHSSLVVSGRFEAPVSDNLAWRALKVLEDVLEVPIPYRIHLHKSLPVGAGLGGGSADAAAVLRWGMAANPRVQDKILAAAASLGADVPFLTGVAGRTARATGRGDALEALVSPAVGTLVIAYPGVVVPTRAVYEAFDRVGSTAPPSTPGLVDALRRRVIPFQLSNQLELAAFHVAPGLACFRKSLERVGAPPARTVMSGSGSSYVVWFQDHEEALALAGTLRRAGVPWVRTNRLGKGASDGRGSTGGSGQRRTAPRRI